MEIIPKEERQTDRLPQRQHIAGHSKKPTRRSSNIRTAKYSYPFEGMTSYEEVDVSGPQETTPVVYISKEKSFAVQFFDRIIEFITPWILLFAVPFLFCLAIMPFTFLPGGGNYDRYIAPIFDRTQQESVPSYTSVEEKAETGSNEDPASLRDSWKSDDLDVILIDSQTGQIVTNEVTRNNWRTDGLISYSNDTISMFVKAK